MSAQRAVLASNPLDTKTPSYFELVEMYQELWGLMVQQRERAERAERRVAKYEGLLQRMLDEGSLNSGEVRLAMLPDAQPAEVKPT